MSLLAALMTALLHSIWQVGLLGAGYAVLRLALRRPQERYALALATLAAQVGWPALTFARALEPRALAISASIPDGRWWTWVPVIWSVGATLMLVRFAGALAAVRRLLETGSAIDQRVADALQAIAVRMGVRPTSFLGSTAIDSPLTLGFWRPAVLIPVSMVTALPLATLELLVAHELMHVRRWDYLVNLLQSLAEALLFFHPALWWVSRRARDEREYCCDDGVVSYLGQGRSLAQALLELEQHRQPGGLLAVASTGGSFMNRIRRLVVDRRQPRAALPYALAFAGILGLTAACAAALEESSPVPRSIPLAASTAPSLVGFCKEIRESACKPERASVDPADLLTVVMNEMYEEKPALKDLLEGIASIPAPLKRGVFKQSIADVIGQPWNCSEFDQLWESQRLSCAPN